METFSALLAFCAGNSPVPDEFSAQRPVTRSFDIFFDLHLNNELSKQSRGWWFETPSDHCDVSVMTYVLRIYVAVALWTSADDSLLFIFIIFVIVFPHIPPLPLPQLNAKFFRGNKNIYLHFMSFLHVDMTQVVEIIP